MSLPRLSTRALRAFKPTSLTKPTTRSISITGSSTFSSLLTSDKPAPSSTKVPRLPASATIDIDAPVRHFNTSRSMKAVGDTSTIDFMYIPEFEDVGAAPVQLRVPILPFTEASKNVKGYATEADEAPVMMPTIVTAAADGTHIHAPSAMSDMTDSDHIDFEGMANAVAETLAKPVEEGQSMVKQVWSGLVEDILGPKQGHAKA